MKATPRRTVWQHVATERQLPAPGRGGRNHRHLRAGRVRLREADVIGKALRHAAAGVLLIVVIGWMYSDPWKRR